MPGTFPIRLSFACVLCAWFQGLSRSGPMQGGLDFAQRLCAAGSIRPEDPRPLQLHSAAPRGRRLAHELDVDGLVLRIHALATRRCNGRASQAGDLDPSVEAMQGNYELWTIGGATIGSVFNAYAKVSRHNTRALRLLSILTCSLWVWQLQVKDEPLFQKMYGAFARASLSSFCVVTHL